jgi:hypothetical protein
MFNQDDSEERNYFGRQKPFDEYAMGVIQDSFERKLSSMVDNRDRPPQKSVREEIKGLISGNRGRRSKGYFSGYSRRR